VPSFVLGAPIHYHVIHGGSEGARGIGREFRENFEIPVITEKAVIERNGSIRICRVVGIPRTITTGLTAESTIALRTRPSWLSQLY